MYSPPSPASGDATTPESLIDDAVLDVVVLRSPHAKLDVAPGGRVAAALADAVARGAMTRAIVDPAADGPEFAAGLLAAGVEVRRLSVTAPLLLIDVRVAAWPDGHGWISTQDATVSALAGVVDTCWRAARAWPRTGPSTRDETLIDLLMEGCTDAVIASRLGVTERSVRRWVAVLSERHGVRTRLQLGAALARERS